MKVGFSAAHVVRNLHGP